MINETQSRRSCVLRENPNINQLGEQFFNYEFHKLNPGYFILFPECCFLYLHQRCYFKYTVYVYFEELFAVAEKQQKKMAAKPLPCALRSHDYHVTGSAN